MQDQLGLDSQGQDQGLDPQGQGQDQGLLSCPSGQVQGQGLTSLFASRL